MRSIASKSVQVSGAGRTAALQDHPAKRKEATMHHSRSQRAPTKVKENWRDEKSSFQKNVQEEKPRPTQSDDKTDTREEHDYSITDFGKLRLV